jgi:ferredoxin-like protein FixX
MSDVEREAMEYDVVVIGAGPSGLSAAIRLKQLEPDLSVVVMDKGSEVGAHILSGAVLDPCGLDALMPDWREKGAPLQTEVVEDRFYLLTQTGQVRIPKWPMPKLMSNHGNYVVSMGNVCRWIAEQAEVLGVEIFPGMAASAVVYEADRVARVVAGEFGLNKDRTPGPNYEPGMEITGNRSPFGTMKHGKTDAEATGPAERFAPIDYPRPDGVLSFDRLTNVAFSFTNHAEEQPAHLVLKDPDVPIAINLPRLAEPAQRYCPAGVYEVVRDADGSDPAFVINFQNCVHCKTCDIKDPSQNIDWATPQGGDGPNYPNM